MYKNNTILIIDDEKSICISLKSILDDEGYHSIYSTSIQEAEKILSEFIPSVILLDVWFGKDSWTGINFLEKINNIYLNIPIIIMSGHANIEMAIRAIKSGAYDFIEKPFNMDLLLITIKRAIENSQDKLCNNNDNRYYFPYYGDIPNLKEATHSNGRLLIYGDKWTGKQELAKYIHYSSNRAQSPCIISNDLSSDILQKVFYGTLIIPDIMQLSIDDQKNLLTLIETEHFMIKNYPVKFFGRLIACTTSKELKKDLYNRLSLIEIYLPNLNKRLYKFYDIIEHTSEYIANELSQKKKVFSIDALNTLMIQEWQGNLKELKNIIERIYIYYQNKTKIDKDDITNILGNVQSSYDVSNIINLSIADARKQFEIEYIETHIKLAQGNIALVAKKIGMDRASLHRKIKLLKSK